jgi:gas vesicle protein
MGAEWVSLTEGTWRGIKMSPELDSPRRGVYLLLRGRLNRACFATQSPEGVFMTAWKEVLIAIGGNATILIVLAFLARSLLQTWLNKDVKKFETGLATVANSELERLRFELKAGADASLERLRMQLHEKSLEHQVRFSKLHERRAEAIEELYSSLVDTQLAARLYIVVTGHDDSVRKEESGKIHRKLYNLYSLAERRRIYLPPPICASLDEFQKTLHKAVTAVDVYSEVTSSASERVVGDREQAIFGAVQAIEEKIPKMRRDLEDEIRRMLGGEKPVHLG